MKLEQFVSEKCKVTSTLRALDVVEQNIVLILPDTAKDEERTSAVTKVTNMLVQNGWIVADIQTLDHAVTVEYTKTCDSVEVMSAMWCCQ